MPLKWHSCDRGDSASRRKPHGGHGGLGKGAHDCSLRLGRRLKFLLGCEAHWVTLGQPPFLSLTSHGEEASDGWVEGGERSVFAILSS